MRANPAEFQLVAPANLRDAVALLGREPGAWLPIAGGTDVMVQYAAGLLKLRKAMSIWGLPELRSIGVSDTEIQIGAACTYSEIRCHKTIVQRVSPAGPLRGLDRRYRQSEPRDPGRKHRQRIAGGRLAASALGVRRRTAPSLRPR